MPMVGQKFVDTLSIRSRGRLVGLLKDYDYRGHMSHLTIKTAWSTFTYWPSESINEEFAMHRKKEDDQTRE